MCGIVGVYGHPEAANIAYLGLHALQHRGQEAAGIVSSDGEKMFASRRLGLVSEAFSGRGELDTLRGQIAIGHVRYATAGDGGLRNAQPLTVDYAHGPLGIGHNGNLVNAPELRRKLELEGSIFSSTSDTEVIVHLLARSKGPDLPSRIIEALVQLEGAYSLVFLSQKEMIAVRDPQGFRPLVLGKLRDSYIIASESCAFDLIEAEFIRDIAPGEMVVIDERGLRSLRPFGQAPRTFCVFEHVYFARPDSVVDERSVYGVRERLGHQLAIEHPADADVVISVPDSGNPAAIGFARQAKIPFDIGLLRSHYVGRTFIEPQQSIRHFGVRLKLSAVREVLADRRVVVVDDSIVRGTTSRKIVKMLRDAGAREVHVRISSPPTTNPCFYGIDTPNRSELIASSHTPEEIGKYLTCDSIGYLSIEGLHKAVAAVGAPPSGGYCDACFTGNYSTVSLRKSANDHRRLA